jgi:hypothetical protein
MIERGHGARIALEAAAPIDVGGAFLAKNFDGQVAVEAGIAGAIDLAHATRTQEGPDLIVAETGIDRKWQGFRSPFTKEWSGLQADAAERNDLFSQIYQRLAQAVRKRFVGDPRGRSGL